jgi:hypothetical protein
VSGVPVRLNYLQENTRKLAEATNEKKSTKLEGLDRSEVDH